jgi:hypothetical protein
MDADHGRRRPTGTLRVAGALWLLRRDALFGRHVQIRKNRYLNNIGEQNRHTIRRRWSAMHGCESASVATAPIAGIELAHQIRKHQFRLGRAHGCGHHAMKSAWDRALFGTQPRGIRQRSRALCAVSLYPQPIPQGTVRTFTDQLQLVRTSSTRRFLARPSGVSFVSFGLEAPYPVVCRRAGSIR